MEKKLTIQALQFYYYKLIQNFFYCIREKQNMKFKKFYFRVFIKQCMYDKEKFLKNFFVLKQFSKCLAKQYTIEKLKEFTNKKLKMRCYFYDKLKIIKIMIMRDSHIDFFKRIKYFKNLKSIIYMNLAFFKKKIYIDFFKKICKSITFKNHMLKKYNDVDEIYKINLITKFLRKMKLASEISYDIKCTIMRKYIVTKKIFQTLKNLYV